LATLLRNLLLVLAYVAFGTVLIIVGDLVIQGLVADAGALPWPFR
jgi:preprotein translocase subunit SecE